MFEETVNIFYDLITQRLRTRKSILSEKNNNQNITFEELSSYIDSNGVEISYDTSMIKHVFGKKIYKYNSNTYSRYNSSWNENDGYTSYFKSYCISLTWSDESMQDL